MTGTQKTLEDIECQLQVQREALRSGSLDDLAETNEALDTLAAALPAGGDVPDRDALLAMRGRARANLDLLEAAMRGVQSVRHRVIEAQRLVSGAQTYDQSGKRRILDTGPAAEDRCF